MKNYVRFLWVSVMLEELGIPKICHSLGGGNGFYQGLFQNVIRVRSHWLASQVKLAKPKSEQVDNPPIPPRGKKKKKNP
jgi:hypothetical protein